MSDFLRLFPGIDRAVIETVDLVEYDHVEEMIANGEICAIDGRPCETERVEEMYGEDADGNRGIRVHYYCCRKCGEER